jgi:hypothetical protein
MIGTGWLLFGAVIVLAMIIVTLTDPIWGRRK